MTHPFARGLTAVLLAVSALAATTAAVSAAPAVNNDPARNTLKIELDQLTLAGRYGDIVARADADLAKATRLPDGSWRGYETYIQFERALMETRAGDDAFWNKLLTTLRQRAEKRPADVFLYVQALHARAWLVRGGGYASHVPASQRHSFRQLMDLARTALDKRSATLAISPIWWAQRTTVANELGEGSDKLSALFEEGVRRFPDFHPLYLTRMRALTPKWGGSEDAMLDLLDRIAAIDGPAREEGLYARAFWVAENEGELVNLDPRFKKDAWRAAVDVIAARWADVGNRQRFFMNGCELSDRALAKDHVDAMDAPIVDELMQLNGGLIDSCRKWAASGEVFLMGVRYRGKDQHLLVQ